jgi:regulatory protein
LKKKRVRSSISPHKPEGHGLPSDKQSHKPEGNGLPSDKQSHKPEGHACLPPRQSLASGTRPNRSGRYAPLRSSQSHNPEKAKEYAFLLLKFRLRSEKELAQRLKQKGFSAEVSQETVNFLKDRQFIDDRVFAKGWVASRLKRPFGLSRIRQELVQKGLAKAVIEETFARAKEDYDEGSIIRQLAEQRFSRLKSVEPVKTKQRVYAYLMRRGFSPDLVREVVSRNGDVSTFK